MRTRFLASLGTLFTSTALAFSQVPSGYYSAYPGAPGYGYYPSYGAPGYGYYPGQGCPPVYYYDQVLPATPAPKSTLPAPKPADKTPPPSSTTPKSPAPSTTPTPAAPSPSETQTSTPSPSPAPDVSATPTDQGQAAEGGNAFASGYSASEGVATPAGVGLASATGVQTGAGAAGLPATVGTTVKSAPAPLVLPGLFTAINVESAITQTRLFMEYGGFHGFEVTNPSGVGTFKGFNLNVLTIGAELAIPEDGVSIYVRVPGLNASNNSSGLDIDGWGDVSVGFKWALCTWDETGSAITVGTTVALPTANDLKITTNRYFFAFDPTGKIRTANGLTLPSNLTRTVNPTYFQPWVAGLCVDNRLILSAYVAGVIPSDDHFATFVNADVGIGWMLYRSCCQDDVVTSIVPTLNVQGLIPVSHQGTPQGSFNPAGTLNVNGATGQLSDTSPQTDFSVNSPYQVFVTGGATFGFGCHAAVSVGAVTPVLGPKAYSVGGVAAFNLLF
jgi:hypothetical protein